MDHAINQHNRVFLVEDAPAIRTRLAEMLGKVAGVTIVGEADTPASAIEGILRTRPDSVVLDVQLIGGSGIEVLREIKPAHPDIVFVVLTNHSEPQYRKIYMANGASYFLDKSIEFEKIKELISGLKTQSINAQPSSKQDL